MEMTSVHMVTKIDFGRTEAYLKKIAESLKDCNND